MAQTPQPGGTVAQTPLQWGNSVPGPLQWGYSVPGPLQWGDSGPLHRYSGGDSGPLHRYSGDAVYPDPCSGDAVYPDPYHGGAPVLDRAHHRPITRVPTTHHPPYTSSASPATLLIATPALTKMSKLTKLVPNGCLRIDMSAYKRQPLTC